MLEAAVEEEVAFLVVGYPFGATTHSDLMLFGCCGLQLYSFGETVSIVMWTDTWQPHSYYDKIASTPQRGLHMLSLLDIIMKEKSIENLIKGRDIYEPPRFMTLPYDEDSACVGLACVGIETQQIPRRSLKDMSNCVLGSPLHSLAIPGKLHPMEINMLRLLLMNLIWSETVCNEGS
ncbi:hypothetical protein MRX96_006970 [Rhipicephalus microplus]